MNILWSEWHKRMTIPTYFQYDYFEYFKFEDFKEIWL